MDEGDNGGASGEHGMDCTVHQELNDIKSTMNEMMEHSRLQTQNMTNMMQMMQSQSNIINNMQGDINQLTQASDNMQGDVTKEVS